MGLIGTCDDCGIEGVPLRFKPDVPSSEQTRPSICNDCRIEREIVLEESRPAPMFPEEGRLP
ncbi:hypothetical protein QIT48_gp07 [Haloterrigena jeotgali icosahedral virus 1]|uniref:Uncharacterized protein n=2 Tax=root TaxID=1 RepID=A0AAF0PFU9_9EURY|nr:hypothetical protein [Natrinema thermotolerans]YP_010772645.1 hypothetical protein QIT48_gp07 [Haloterrigena jeotgali icosahedral virus 1]QCC57409.1 hypothetical protein DVR14_01645 [Natrinema thermotolerans]WMT10386.1 hypothetical protein NP511_22750 [Natrinema thermotolerans]DAC85285.1 TPA_asm: hypothetical protein HJIV1gp7 [Haloterrigena jeotgali icosahedral virus 1]